MCGLGLIVERAPRGLDELRADLATINRTQGHRGPDSEAIWIGHSSKNSTSAAGAVIGICHQRLSILDPSPAGSQPFESPCGRYLLAYNGEIYNYLELAAELRKRGDVLAILDKSSGDTAVLMAAIVAWGPQLALSKMNGMWAFALWDRHECTLLLSRDRFGIKPLFVHLTDERLVVASEVKGILGTTRERFSPNARAVARYLVLGLVGQDRETFFDTVSAFPPASFAEIELSSGWPDQIRSVSYWTHPLVAGEVERTVKAEELRHAFFEAMRVHLRSDVPVGVMLSGGLDSTALAAAAKMLEPDLRMTSLSLVSEDATADESAWVKIAVDSIGLPSVTQTIDLQPDNIPSAVEELTWHADAPLKSLASVGLARLCEEARQNGIMVLLSGQGADEQLAGYDKYLYFYLGERLRAGNFLDAFGEAVRFALNGSVLPSFRFSEAKRYLPHKFLKSFVGPMGNRAAATNWNVAASGTTLRAREFDDLTRFSVPTLLEDEDRMSMSASTEMRVPFLDVNLVEVLAVTPGAEKLSKGWTKAIFRNAFAPFMPAEIAYRRDKKGFSVPHRKLMCGPLRKVVEGTLSDGLLSERAGLINGSGLMQMFSNYLGGSARVSDREIFRYWALEVWMRRFDSHLAY